MSRTMILVCLAAMAVPLALYSRTYRVPDQYDTIQEAIDAARDNDTVLVADGEYTGEGNINLTVDSAIKLIAPSGADSTSIDCLGDDNTTCLSVTGNAVVDGFTFTGATAVAVKVSNCNGFEFRNCIIRENTMTVANQHGAGLIVTQATGRLKHTILRENTTVGSGGGAYINTSSNVTMWDCIAMANVAKRFGGGVQVTGNSSATMGNCLIFANNTDSLDGGGFSISQNSSAAINNCTFMYNQATGGGGGLYKGSNSNPTILNTIFYGNGARQSPGEDIWAQNNGGRVTISYSCVVGGPGDEDGWEGENMIEDDPQVFGGRIPVWGEDGFFLDSESPCIDAGDSSAAVRGMDTLTTNTNLEPDQDIVDMGYHYDKDSFRLLGYLSGHVYDAEDNRTMEGVQVTTTQRQSAETNVRGLWIIPEALAGRFSITASMLGYNDSTIADTFLEEHDTLVFDFSLLHPTITLSEDTLGARLRPDESRDLPFTMQNNGNGPLIWNVERQLPGEANADPWELRRIYNVGEVTGDPKIRGVVYVADSLYVAGGGLDTNYIYVLNQDGDFVRRFLAPDQLRDGLTDLDWDGNLIWGAGGGTVYGFDLNGDVQTTFETEFRAVQAIAWDSDQQLLWVASITGPDIIGFAVDGTQITSVSDHDFLVFGLAYYPQDPDGYNLYILHSDQAGTFQRVHKMNLATQDTIYCADLDAGPGGPKGAFITNEFDIYSWVFFAVTDNGESDRIDLWHLAGNTSWMRVSPAYQGVLGPGEVQDMALTLNASGAQPGRLRGSLLFQHNAYEEENIIDVWMEIFIPDTTDAAKPDDAAPTEFAIHSVTPNPFNAATTIVYSLPTASDVVLHLYDLTGRETATLQTGMISAGRQHLTINARQLPSGIYLGKLQAGEQYKMVKLVLMR